MADSRIDQEPWPLPARNGSDQIDSARSTASRGGARHKPARKADKIVFIVISLVLGVFIGPAQSASRTLVARLAPENMIAQTYGLYAFTGKSVSFLGPLCFAAATDIFDSQRAGMATIIVLACRDGVAGEGKGKKIDWTRLQTRPAVSRDQVHAASGTRDRRGGNRSGIPRRAATEKKRQAAIHAVCPRSVGGGIPTRKNNSAT